MTKRTSGASVAVVLFFAVAACNRPAPDAEIPAAQTDAPTQLADSDALDDEITTEVQSKFFSSSDVRHLDIDVDTDDGIVRLSGTVASAAERDEAVSIARGVDNVVRVEDAIAIAPGRARVNEPASRSPEWIEVKVKSQYYLNPQLKPWRIDVRTAPDGAVTLAGMVDSEADRQKLVELARTTDGVTNVTDRLHIARETAATTGATAAIAQSASDALITSKIQARFFVDDDVRGRNINVDTKDGHVTLSGTVGSYGERNIAASIARNTDGVRNVTDNLQLAPEDKAARDSDLSVDKVERTFSDAWLTTKVQAKFLVDEHVQARKIDVNTANGVVTLNGTVQNAAAREQAERLARETDGVKRVENRLTVAS